MYVGAWGVALPPPIVRSGVCLNSGALCVVSTVVPACTTSGRGVHRPSPITAGYTRSLDAKICFSIFGFDSANYRSRICPTMLGAIDIM